MTLVAITQLLTYGSILCALTVSSNQRGAWAISREPPVIDESKYEKRVVVAEGDMFKLVCPVIAGRDSLFSWSKDGEEISLAWGSRYRLGEESLRVKSAQPSDSGVYVCRAANGFGSVDIKHLVHVKANNSDDQSTPITFEEAPVLVGMSVHEVTASLGEEIALFCSATGYPVPRIEWYKEGVMQLATASETSVNKKQEKVTSVLRRHSISIIDAGIYTCRAYNTRGAANFTYTVSIKLEKPEVNLNLVQNISVYLNEPATFECRVESYLEPNIRWFKHTDTSVRPGKGSLDPMEINGEFFVELTSKLSRLSPDVYSSRLHIESVSYKDAGMYVCLMTTSSNVLFKHAFLEVRTDNGDIINEKKTTDDVTYLPIILAVIGVGTLVFVAAIAFIAHRHRARKSPGSQGTKTPPIPPTSVNHPPPTPSSSGAPGSRSASEKHHYAAVGGAPCSTYPLGVTSGGPVYPPVSRNYPRCDCGEGHCDGQSNLISDSVSLNDNSATAQQLMQQQYYLRQQHLRQEQPLLEHHRCSNNSAMFC